MARKAGERSDYAQRLGSLMRQLQASLGPDVAQVAVWRAYRQLMKVRKVPSVAAATFNPWFGGGTGAIVKELADISELSLAVFCQAQLSGEDPKWGTDPDDMDTPLNHLRDLLRVGPGVKPNPRRWDNEPTAAEILASASPSVAEMNNAIITMSPLEAIEVMACALDHLRAVVINAEPETDSDTEPPCDENNPTWLALQALLGLDGHVTDEVVELVASKSGLDAARTRQILCGDSPNPDEIEGLSLAANVGAQRFRVFLKAFAEELQTQDA